MLVSLTIIIVFSQHMGTKHPQTKEDEPVDYFSQLSTTNTDCLIDIIVRETNMYARQHFSLEFCKFKPFENRHDCSTIDRM
jgi:hypothetical protein